MRLRVRRIVVLVAQIIKNAVTFVTIINGVHQSADRDQSNSADALPCGQTVAPLPSGR
jgi:hypothetical protein